jgi:hypothetical protein
MKKFAKRAAAFLLAAVLSLSLAGCYNENLTWSARKWRYGASHRRIHLLSLRRIQ